MCDGTQVEADGRCERLGVVCMAEPTGVLHGALVVVATRGSEPPDGLRVCVCEGGGGGREREDGRAMEGGGGVGLIVVVWGGVMRSWELFRGSPKGALCVVLAWASKAWDREGNAHP